MMKDPMEMVQSLLKKGRVVRLKRQVAIKDKIIRQLLKDKRRLYDDKIALAKVVYQDKTGELERIIDSLVDNALTIAGRQKRID